MLAEATDTPPRAVLIDTYPPTSPRTVLPDPAMQVHNLADGILDSLLPDSYATDERVFIGASYVDLSAADADFQALRQLYVDRGAASDFDAVTIGRKASGEVRFHREPDRSQGSAEDQPVAPSLAAGLGAALFPSVAADTPVRRLEGREILGTIAGVVATALGRSGLGELGNHLDSTSAGLIVAAAAEQQDRVLAVLANALGTMARSATVDFETIKRRTDRLHRTASKSRPNTS